MRSYEYMDEAEQWVVDWYADATAGIDGLYNLELAESDLRDFQRDDDDLPEGLTAELLMEVWNELVLSRYENVELPDGNWVPRHTQMTDKQIAEVIKEADSWDEVEDLVEYVSETYLHLRKDNDGYYAGDWDRAVEDWCDEQ